MSSRTDFGWFVSLRLIAFTLLVFNQALAEDVFTSKRVAPQESYELDYLGCKNADPSSAKRIGVFQLIWKADDPTKLLVDVSQNPKKVDPVTDFVVHIEPGTVPFKGIYPLPPGWLYVGHTGLIEPGRQWLEIKPGQVITFETGISIIESGLHWFTTVQNAKGDRARLLIETKAGQLASDDIILPLLPTTAK